MSLILVKILILRQKSGGARKHSSLASQKVGGLKPSGLIEVYAYVYPAHTSP